MTSPTTILNTIASGIYTNARGAVKFVGQGIHGYSGTLTKWVGHTVQVLTTNEPISNTTFNPSPYFYAGAFAYFAYTGAKQMRTPLPNGKKWFCIENRFEKSSKVVVKPVKITDMLKVPASITDSVSKAAEMDLDSAQKALAQVKAELDVAQENQRRADRELTDAKRRLDEYIRTDYRDYSRFSKAVEESDKALQQANLAVEKIEKRVKPSEEAVEKAQKNVEELKKNPLKMLPGPTEKKGKEEVKLNEDALLMATVIERSDKPPAGQYYFSIPLSNQAFVYNHQAFKESFADTSMGAVKFSVGTLGFCDNLPATVKYSLLGDGLGLASSTIGNCGRFVGYIVGSLIGGITSFDSASYGLGNIIGAGGLSYGSYRLLKSTKLEWFNWKPKAGETCFQGKTFRSDAVKLGGSLLCGSLAVFSANEFLSGGSKAT